MGDVRRPCPLTNKRRLEPREKIVEGDNDDSQLAGDPLFRQARVEALGVDVSNATSHILHGAQRPDHHHRQQHQRKSQGRSTDTQENGEQTCQRFIDGCRLASQGENQRRAARNSRLGIRADPSLCVPAIPDPVVLVILSLVLEVEHGTEPQSDDSHRPTPGKLTGREQGAVPLELDGRQSVVDQGWRTGEHLSRIGPQLVVLRTSGIPVLRRPAVLGELEVDPAGFLFHERGQGPGLGEQELVKGVEEGSPGENVGTRAAREQEHEHHRGAARQ